MKKYNWRLLAGISKKLVVNQFQNIHQSTSKTIGGLTKRLLPVHYASLMEKLQKPKLHADWIDPDARSIVDRLQKAGFPTYLVGGCVRDLLAGIHPKDFDIATSAHPEQVRKLIRGSYIIGKRFQLVLVKRGPYQFEVATFRRNALPEEIEVSELSFADNFFGTPQEDAQRRDFTINGLFYDPIRDELLDFVDGIKDVEQGLIRMIGDPDYRLKEDPIRILRAIRLSHKLRFSIEENLRSAIERHSEELKRSILPRKREEYFKMMRLEDPGLVFQELFDLNILNHIFPTLNNLWSHGENASVFRQFLERTHEICDDSTSTTLLMLPLLLGLNEILNLQKENTEKEFNLVDNLFKNEWGLFKTEQQSLYEAIDLLAQMQQIDGLLRKGHRRQRSFFARDNLPLALAMANANYLFSGEQWLKITQLLKQFQVPLQRRQDRTY
jgi:poly(A) polymerase